MSHNPKEAEKEMKKAIFIPSDCWLDVFILLPRSQLGLKIALISHRFDYFVDEHFKTRKWTLDKLEIRWKIGENGAKEMEIVNADGKELPIPQNPLPNKIIGFERIWIYFFDHNVLTFLRRFHRFFASSATTLCIHNENVRIAEFIVFNIWPMFKDTIFLLNLNTIGFHQLRQLAPSLLNECPSLCIFNLYNGISLEFPPDDSANASDGQTVAKWLFTPRPDNLTKELSCVMDSTMEYWSATVKHIKAAFASASSPVNFVICVCFPPSSFSAVVPFQLTNAFTGEKLTLELAQDGANVFNLIRCSIAAGDDGERSLFGGQKNNNRIELVIRDDRFDDGLLNAVSSAAGPSDGDQKQ